VRSRLEDLLATAERQLAARSYDAAIDTCRTALNEPGAAEAGVQERLGAACRVRDEARGIVRPVEAPALPVEIAAPPVEPPAETPADPEPPPAPLPVEPFRTIEPPSIKLHQPDVVATIERQDFPDYQLEVEKLSILHPSPAPEDEENGSLPMKQIALAILICGIVCLIAVLLK